jgi:hypothetical protein
MVQVEECGAGRQTDSLLQSRDCGNVKDVIQCTWPRPMIRVASHARRELVG